MHIPQVRMKETHWSGAEIHYYQGYEIMYINQHTNTLVAREEMAIYAVSLSGGLGSAAASFAAYVATDAACAPRITPHAVESVSYEKQVNELLVLIGKSL